MQKPVLIIDSDEVRAQRLEDALVPLGISVRQVSCLFSALEDVLECQPSAILCADRSGTAAPERVCELEHSSHEIQTIPVIAYGSKEERRAKLLRLGCCDYLQTPLNGEEVAARIESLLTTLHAPGLTGEFSDVGLPDLIQLFVSSRRTGTMEVEADSAHGTLHFKDGQVIGCLFGEEIGEDALLTLLRTCREQGRFSFTKRMHHFTGPNIQKRTDHLLLSLANQIDEEG